MTTLWTAIEAQRATGGNATKPFSANGVSIDSRTIKPGDLFVALRGPNFDGHEFVAAVRDRKAAAAVVSGPVDRFPDDLPLLVVQDTRRALSDLAAHARARSRARITAVTGSVGKTGTKDCLALALSRQAPTAASVGNLNNEFGLPLSLARMPADAVYGVYELGMNHAGEIESLSTLLKPEIAVITTVEPVHLEFFPSEEAIADAKAEVFAGMTAHGTAILNRDNHHFARLYRHASEAGIGTILGFGVHPKADVRLVDCSLQATSSKVTASVGGDTIEFDIGVPGRHWVMNSLAVLAAVRAVGADHVRAAQTFSDLRPAKGRGEQQKIALGNGDSFVLIDESYNASPTSMRAAFEVLAQTEIAQEGRRIAVLGDMLELGDASADMHADLAQDLVRLGVDVVFTAGPMMGRLANALPTAMRGGHAATSGCLAPRVTAAVRDGDVIMVKGSLGSQMRLVVDALQSLDGLQGPPRRAANGG